MNYRILHLGDSAVTFELGNEISRRDNAVVLALHHALKERMVQNPVIGIIESVPTFRSLTVHFDPLVLFPDDVVEIVTALFDGLEVGEVKGKTHVIACCYEGEYAPDLSEVATRCSLSVNEIITLHSAQEYDVFMLGFLPGFAFLGEIDPRLILPRRSDPRTAVPQGSVAIADKLTAVYPSQSPGGWHLIGRTHQKLFDLGRKNPAVLRPGDRVRFEPVRKNEFEGMAP